MLSTLRSAGTFLLTLPDPNLRNAYAELGGFVGTLMEPEHSVLGKSGVAIITVCRLSALRSSTQSWAPTRSFLASRPSSFLLGPGSAPQGQSGNLSFEHSTFL